MNGTLEQRIASHPFLKGMAPEFIPFFVPSVETLLPEEVIFREGAPARDFYLIESGRVGLEVFLPDNLTIQTLSAGEALGWSWMFEPAIWHFTARAITPSVLLRFSAEDLLARSQEHPVFGRDLAMRVSRTLLQRLQATRLQLMDFYALSQQ